MANRSSKNKQPPVRIFVRIYPEHDLSLIAYLREKSKKERRSLAWLLTEAAREQLTKETANG